MAEAGSVVLKVDVEGVSALLDRLEALITRLELAQGQVSAAGGELFNHALTVRADLESVGEKIKADARAHTDALKAEVQAQADEVKADLEAARPKED